MNRSGVEPFSTLPSWPRNAQPAGEVLSESSRLCVECGLCCTGAYLSWAPVSAKEIATYSDTSTLPYRDTTLSEDDDPLRMVLPCACHVGGLCSIFPNRPAVCGNYRCDLLKATLNGSVAGEEARQITAKIKAQFEWLRSAAEKLGYFSASRTSLISILRSFCREVEARLKVGTAYPHEAQFVRNAFEYLQNVDRHLERKDLVYGIGDIISRLDRHISGFDVPESEICRLSLDGGNALELRGCSELTEPLRKIIKGWNLEEIASGDEAFHVVMRVWKSGEKYFWDMPFPGPYFDDDDPLTDPMDVLHEIHFYLDDIYALEKPSHFFLHSAAVEINGAIVLLLGSHETGKSTLVMALAARGHRVLADDRIAIDPTTGHAVAMGSVPLLRKPLPSDEGFWPAKSLLKKYRGPEDDSYVYADLPEDLFAPKGYSGSVTAVVTLDLSEKPTATVLAPMTKAEAVTALVLQYYGKTRPASEALDGMLKIAETARAFSLKFAKTKTAVREIEGIFSAGASPSPELALNGVEE
jgi:hypothetical protein